MARLGTAVSKKVRKRAVDRNRIKRIVRESFRLRAPTLPALDVVISISTRRPLRDEADLRRALGRLWDILSGQ